jgi:hypothetical protein
MNRWPYSELILIVSLLDEREKKYKTSRRQVFRTGSEVVSTHVRGHAAGVSRSWLCRTAHPQIK